MEPTRGYMQEPKLIAFRPKPPPGLCEEVHAHAKDTALSSPALEAARCDTPGIDPNSVTRAYDAHLRQECKPCAYFWHKEDGCRAGSECEFCHLCDESAMRNWKKAKKQRKRAEAAEARLAIKAGARKVKSLAKREAVAVEPPELFLSASEPARVCVDVSTLHHETDPNDRIASGMPLRVSLMSRPYFPTGMTMKLSRSSSPRTDLKLPADICEPMPQGAKEVFHQSTDAPSAMLVRTNALPDEPCKVVSEIAKPKAPAQGHSFRDSRVPYW